MTATTPIADTVKSRFNAQAADGLDCIFQLNFDDGETYHLVVKEGTCEVVEGLHDAPNVTLIMSKGTLMGIMTGELEGTQCFMMGKIRVEGDMMLATKLNTLFSA